MATRYIAFGYTDVGTVTAIIRRASDGYYWNPATNAWQAGSVSCTMTHDSVLQQYYLEESPTERCYWSAFDSANNPLAYGEYGGGFPTISDPGSASAYTMAEVLARIRVELRDVDGDLWSDAELLNILDRCHGWLLDQCYKKKANIGVKKATYTGDGTTEWGVPSDFLGLRYIIYPNSTYGVFLEPRTKGDYDIGALALGLTYPTYYVIDQTNKLYFIPNLGTGVALNFYYYGRPVKLTAATSVPLDGVFMDLMVEWGKTVALQADEFSAKFEQGMLQMFMRDARNHIDIKSSWPRRAKVRMNLYRGARRGKST